ncbi:MAG: hypothetical protein GY863_03840 [bacterium]|nr:hypothetical protein [bacterium]
MPSVRVKKELNSEIYFLTICVVDWQYVLDKFDNWEILLDSIVYCQKEKRLKVHSLVFMLNHIHLIIQNQDVAGFIRDFKKYTSKRIKENFNLHDKKLLKYFTRKNNFQFWQKTNMPELIKTEKFYVQKKQYIENNPVRKKYVKAPQDWVYSSANPELSIHIDQL